MGKQDPKEYYKEEARELLDNIEHYLLDLEDNPNDQNVINNIFRALHTIKGSGSMFGFENIASFTHDVETLFDKMREGTVSVTKEIVDLTLASRDHIRSLLEWDDQFPDSESEEAESVLKRRLGELMSSSGKNGDTQKEEESDQDVGSEKTYRIVFRPNKDIFLRGVNPVSLVQEIRNLGKNVVLTDNSGIPFFEELNPEQCYIKWTIIVTTRADLNEIKDIFIFVEDYAEIKIDIIDQGSIEAETDYKRIGEILHDRGSISENDIETILRKKAHFGELAQSEGGLSDAEIQSALEEQKYVRDLRKQRLESTNSSSIRVNNKKLDELVDLVGELVTLQARLSQYSENLKNPEVETIAENLERLIAELRDNTMNIRMVPLAETFRSFYRLIRDLSNDLGKEVELVTLGADTELDKNIIDLLKDPLVHVLRNAIDHGIETPAVRKEIGKPEKGTITLEAKHVGANVTITLTDDGKGLDPEKLKAKGIEKGIIKENASLSDEEAFSLIFEPGFSTTEKATSVSGRGVGMDVVKKNIERLRGSIDVTSQIGKGAAIVLTIPLTLSIIDGLLVSVKEDKYIINLSQVSECFDFTDDLIHRTNGSSIAKIRGELVPYIKLRELFKYTEKTSELEQMAIINHEGTKLGIVVDNIIGQYQTVIKPMSGAFKRLEEVSGSTILGDGSISFILDINKIAKNLELSRKKS